LLIRSKRASQTPLTWSLEIEELEIVFIESHSVYVWKDQTEFKGFVNHIIKVRNRKDIFDILIVSAPNDRYPKPKTRTKTDNLKLFWNLFISNSNASSDTILTSSSLNDNGEQSWVQHINLLANSKVPFPEIRDLLRFIGTPSNSIIRRY
jgi:hypothetical protein